jgi:hypothetical protein
MKALITYFNDELFSDVKVSPEDVWDARTTLAVIILPVLQLFRKNLNGWPANEDFPELKDWENGIDEMIAAFELIVEDDDWNWTHKEELVVKRGLRLFGTYYLHLWD